jgi:hypothetical protein
VTDLRAALEASTATARTLTGERLDTPAPTAGPIAPSWHTIGHSAQTALAWAWYVHHGHPPRSTLAVDLGLAECVRRGWVEVTPDGYRLTVAGIELLDQRSMRPHRFHRPCDGSDGCPSPR